MEIEDILSDEIILHRIPPPESENTKPAERGRNRPISQRLQTLSKDARGLSCSRLKQTSPRNLLGQLVSHGKDPEGWSVCFLRVGDVRDLGLDVIHVPRENDPGHCEIRGQFVRKTPKRLSEIARMLTSEELGSIVAGDTVD